MPAIPQRSHRLIIVIRLLVVHAVHQPVTKMNAVVQVLLEFHLEPHTTVHFRTRAPLPAFVAPQGQVLYKRQCRMYGIAYSVWYMVCDI